MAARQHPIEKRTGKSSYKPRLTRLDGDAGEDGLRQHASSSENERAPVQPSGQTPASACAPAGPLMSDRKHPDLAKTPWKGVGE